MNIFINNCYGFMPGKLQVISGTQKEISNCKVVISFSFDVILLLRIHFNLILNILKTYCIVKH